MKNDLIIIGAGGHAKVIIDILKKNKDYNVLGCIDKEKDKLIIDVPVIGDDNDLAKLYSKGVKYAFVALGSNKVRKKLSEDLLKIGYELINVISKDSIVSDNVKLGKGIAIMPGAIINIESTIEDGAIVNTGATVDHDCLIGPYVHIAPGCNIAGCVKVGEGSFLGVGSCVIDRISIGDWVTIGGGAAVVNDIESNCTVVGVPARIIKIKE